MVFVRLTPDIAAAAVMETDWASLDRKTDEQIEAASAADPDAPPFHGPSREEVVASMVRAVRAATSLTREAFAQVYGIPLEALVGWEEAADVPDLAVQSYLRVIARKPKVIARLAAA